MWRKIRVIGSVPWSPGGGRYGEYGRGVLVLAPLLVAASDPASCRVFSDVSSWRRSGAAVAVRAVRPPWYAALARPAAITKTQLGKVGEQEVSGTPAAGVSGASPMQYFRRSRSTATAGVTAPPVPR